MNKCQHTDCTDLVKLQRAGLDALKKALGTEGMVNFLQIYRHGSKINNYTEERHKWLDKDVTLDELIKDVEALDREDDLPSPPHENVPAFRMG
jgi:hypothetical protein